MEEPSMFSVGITNQSGEVSDSNSSILNLPPTQSPTHNVNGVSASSKFKGVVSQQNGHWGAQIYANHQRIWLGTFKSEKEAATAYDSAAIKLRNGDAQRNFPWNETTVHEPNFQTHFSTEQVLSMIKDGSYPARFSDYLKTHVSTKHINLANLKGSGDVKLRELFQKELTPSDVSKLNRLVIPKKYAVKYFPRISDVEGNNEGGLDDVELVFYDRSMRVWKFRYCYWKSSQSFVFTRGWNRFTKEKGLKPKDRIIFSAYEYCDGMGGMQNLCVIDVEYNADGKKVEQSVDGESDETSLELAIGQPGGLRRENKIRRPDQEFDRMVKQKVDGVSPKKEEKGFKLFGVQIII